MSRHSTVSPDHGEASYRGAARLDGAVAIVTEGDSGIGRAVAIAFAREGADVVIAHCNEQEGGEETARWVKQANRRVLIVEGDARDTQFQKALVDRVIGEWGRLDILVNHSAFQWAHEPVAEDATELEQQLRTQTEGVFFLAKTAAAQMKPGSAIINTSVMRYRSSASQIRVHAAHEQAVTNLTVSLAHSLARAGIRVNAVEAGPVWTPRVLATLSADEIASFGSRTLLGRAAHPAEIAPAYVFLASREASYITGAVLPVTGGELSPEPLGPISRSDQS